MYHISELLKLCIFVFLTQNAETIGVEILFIIMGLILYYNCGEREVKGFI